MFPSKGYFKSEICPFYDSGLCERPYCHFRHVKRDRPQTSAPPMNNIINQQELIQQMVDKALKKVLLEKSLASAISDFQSDLVAATTSTLTSSTGKLKPDVESILPVSVRSISVAKSSTPVEKGSVVTSSATGEETEPPEKVSRSKAMMAKVASAPSYNPTPISVLKKREQTSDTGFEVYTPPDKKLRMMIPAFSDDEDEEYTPGDSSTNNFPTYAPSDKAQDNNSPCDPYSPVLNKPLENEYVPGSVKETGHSKKQEYVVSTPKDSLKYVPSSINSRATGKPKRVSKRVEEYEPIPTSTLSNATLYVPTSRSILNPKQNSLPPEAIPTEVDNSLQSDSDSSEESDHAKLTKDFDILEQILVESSVSGVMDYKKSGNAEKKRKTKRITTVTKAKSNSICNTPKAITQKISLHRTHMLKKNVFPLVTSKSEPPKQQPHKDFFSVLCANSKTKTELELENKLSKQEPVVVSSGEIKAQNSDEDDRKSAIFTPSEEVDHFSNKTDDESDNLQKDSESKIESAEESVEMCETNEPSSKIEEKSYVTEEKVNISMQSNTAIDPESNRNNEVNPSKNSQHRSRSRSTHKDSTFSKTSKHSSHKKSKHKSRSKSTEKSPKSNHSSKHSSLLSKNGKSKHNSSSKSSKSKVSNSSSKSEKSKHSSSPSKHVKSKHSSHKSSSHSKKKRSHSSEKSLLSSKNKPSDVEDNSLAGSIENGKSEVVFDGLTDDFDVDFNDMPDLPDELDSDSFEREDGIESEPEDEDPSLVEAECFQIFQEYQPDKKQNLDAKKVRNSQNACEEGEEKSVLTMKKRVAHDNVPPERYSYKPLVVKKPSRPSPAQVMLDRLKKLHEERNKIESEEQERELNAAEIAMLFHSDPTPTSSHHSSKSSRHPHKKNTSSTSGGAGKKRIAHVPNVSSILKEKGKMVLNNSTKDSSTTAQTQVKGAKRQAHVPAKISLQRPMIDADSSSKVAANIRQQYLNLLIDECLKLCDGSEREAFDRGLEEERKCYERCTSKIVYVSVTANAIARLRKETDGVFSNKTSIVSSESSANNPSGTVSHISVLAGKGGAKGSWSIEKGKKTSEVNVSALNVHQFLQKYVLSSTQLEENGFPRSDPSEKGKAIVLREETRVRNRACSNPYERICSRCGKLYSVNKKGIPLLEEQCVYHHGRAYKKRGFGGMETSYSCCQGDSETEGCGVSKCHVSENFDPNNLRGFVKTLYKPQDPNQEAVYALDCEMCYTTMANELTRLTVIGPDMETVYETLVLPENPIIDYNTRFSGITEEDMQGVTTSLRDVQAVLLSWFSSKTILIGHSLESDFKALKLIHDTVVDTSVVFPHKMGPPYKRALKNLSGEYLKKIIQNDVGGHDSAEDAKACMELMIWKVREDLKSL